jgi:uncharacterized protein YgbK (DUF1537 family)
MSGEIKPKLLLIADDLTGAIEAGGQLASRNVPNIVFTTPDFGDLPRDYEAVVVNTESRHLSPGEAARRVFSVAAKGEQTGVPFFYKKTDSTLRGNLGAELEAFAASTRVKVLPFIAAHPEVGRTTVQGIHFVHGVRLAETSFRNDPLNPVRHSIVAEVLAVQSGWAAKRVTHIDFPNEGAGFWIFDCESREDLGRIARCLRRENRLRAVAGSAAFVQELPAVLELGTERAELPRIRQPFLVINGSLNEVSLEQVREGLSSFDSLRLGVEILSMEEEAFLANATAKAARIDARENLLLYTILSADEAERFNADARALGLDSPAAAQAVRQRLAKLALRLLRERKIGTLVISGGDTFMAIAEACEWGGLRPRAQLVPGITLSQPEGSDLVLVTKPGGFGQPDFFARLISAP